MNQYYLREEYQLALKDLELNCKPELFNYLLEVLSEGHEKPTVTIVEIDNDNTSSFSSSSTTTTSGRERHQQLQWSNSDSNCVSDKDKDKGDDDGDQTMAVHRLSARNDNHANTINRDSVSVQPKIRIKTKDNIKSVSKVTTPTRCSSLPVCRKILYKIPVSAQRASSQSSSSSERGRKIVKKKLHSAVPSVPADEIQIQMMMGNMGLLTTQSQYKTPYEPLIGKIDQSTPLLFDRGRKLPKPEKGVREFSNPISNPLYKVYNPKGYIKNQDEVAREFIMNITGKFNEWLRSFDGEPVQLCPEVIIKILREDLELPFKNPVSAQQKKKEREKEESKPKKLYTTRFQFEQPHIKLDLS